MRAALDRVVSNASKRLPHVLLVCPVADQIGGAEKVMLAIARELPSHGFSPVIAVMRPGVLVELARTQGTETYAFPEDHRYRDIGSIRRAASWLTDVARRTGASLQHATHTAHLYAYFASQSARIPELWHVHDLPSDGDPVSWLNRRLIPNHTLFTTKLVAEAYPRLLKHPYTVVLPTCVEPNVLRHRERRYDVRSRFGLPEGPMLLTVARLQAHKGHSYLVHAAAQVLRRRPDAVFAVVGTAKTRDQERYREELLVQAQRFGVSERVRLIGSVDDADLAELYRQSTALVHPAWSEGYGLVLLEAMSMGLPVIAAAAAGPAEILRNGNNGILVPVRDAAALADAVIQVISEDSLRSQLKAAGTVTVEQLTLHEMVTRTAVVYRQMISADSRATVRQPEEPSSRHL